MSRLRRQLLPLLLAVPCLAIFASAQSTESKAFASARPTERVEYWQRRLAEITDTLKAERTLASVRLVFVGDSITDFWTMAKNPWFPDHQMGRAIWDESFGATRGENAALNLGISGDRTEHVLYRLLPRAEGGLGQLDSPALDPDVVVLLIGVNNTWDAESPVVESVTTGIRAVIDSIHARKPRAKMIVQSLLPLPDNSKNHTVIQPINEKLRAMVATPELSRFATFLDLYPAFVDSDGKQLSSHFADGVHPAESGYRIWRDLLVPALARVRAASHP